MRILVLSTWVPYPPVHGAKIRASQLIRALATHHDVALCTFADPPVQPDAVAALARHCVRVDVIPEDPFARRRLRAARGWLSRRPSLAVAAYSPAMTARVRTIAANWRPERVLGFTWLTAPYALAVPAAVRVLDMDYVVSRLLQERYEQSQRPLERARRWLAWQKCLAYERRMLGEFDHCLTSSPVEESLLRAMTSRPRAQVHVISNGVDTTWYRPGLAPPQLHTLIYNGSPMYDANRDAVEHFVQDVLPRVQASVSDVRLRVTGHAAPGTLAGLSRNGHVTLTGFLDDVRPVVAASWACVVPLRFGGGTRVKILEAMALGTPVVSTSKGAEGLRVVAGEHLLIADTPAAFAAATIRLLHDPDLRARLSRRARRLVEDTYDWTDVTSGLRRVVEGTTVDAATR